MLAKTNTWYTARYYSMTRDCGKGWAHKGCFRSALNAVYGRGWMFVCVLDSHVKYHTIHNKLYYQYINILYVTDCQTEVVLHLYIEIHELSRYWCMYENAKLSCVRVCVYKMFLFLFHTAVLTCHPHRKLKYKLQFNPPYQNISFMLLTNCPIQTARKLRKLEIKTTNSLEKKQKKNIYLKAIYEQSKKRK